MSLVLVACVCEHTLNLVIWNSCLNKVSSPGKIKFTKYKLKKTHNGSFGSFRSVTEINCWVVVMVHPTRTYQWFNVKILVYLLLLYLAIYCLKDLFGMLGCSISLSCCLVIQCVILGILCIKSMNLPHLD